MVGGGEWWVVVDGEWLVVVNGGMGGYGKFRKIDYDDDDDRSER